MNLDSAREHFVEMRTRAADPANRSTTTNIITEMLDEGIDFDDEQVVQEWIDRYNARPRDERWQRVVSCAFAAGTVARPDRRGHKPSGWLRLKRRSHPPTGDASAATTSIGDLGRVSFRCPSARSPGEQGVQQLRRSPSIA